jgi:hypothetical protein
MAHSIDAHLAAVHQHNTATLKQWRGEVRIRNTMTKAEARELQSVKTYLTAGMPDTAARALSAMVRATRNRTTSAELMTYAAELNLLHRPEFII